MGKRGRQEYLRAILKRYELADKTEKRAILDQFCKVREYNRKYAVRLLSRGEIEAEHRPKRSAGRRKRYADPAILEALRYIWENILLPMKVKQS